MFLRQDFLSFPVIDLMVCRRLMGVCRLDSIGIFVGNPLPSGLLHHIRNTLGRSSSFGVVGLNSSESDCLMADLPDCLIDMLECIELSCPWIVDSGHTLLLGNFLQCDPSGCIYDI